MNLFRKIYNKLFVREEKPKNLKEILNLLKTETYKDTYVLSKFSGNVDYQNHPDIDRNKFANFFYPILFELDYYPDLERIKEPTDFEKDVLNFLIKELEPMFDSTFKVSIFHKAFLNEYNYGLSREIMFFVQKEKGPFVRFRKQLPLTDHSEHLFAGGIRYERNKEEWLDLDVNVDIAKQQLNEKFKIENVLEGKFPEKGENDEPDTK